jgi:hypothetical protein
MLTCDQLSFAVNKLYPNLVCWKDYWTAHPVESNSDKQIGEAEIIAWKPKDIPQPSLDALRTTFAQHEDEWQAQIARQARDAELKASDWTQMPDIEECKRTAWAKYRQQLRDLPQQKTFPKRIGWPEAPKGE